MTYNKIKPSEMGYHVAWYLSIKLTQTHTRLWS